MTPWMTTIVAVAFAGLAALSILDSARQRTVRPFLLSTAVLTGLAFLLHRFFGFPTAHPISASKGVAPSELPVIGLLFACMLLGMLAHWLYAWLETPQRNGRRSTSASSWGQSSPRRSSSFRCSHRCRTQIWISRRSTFPAS